MLSKRFTVLPSITFAIAALSGSIGNSATTASTLEFGRDVLPILSENCFACHGPDAADRKADLRLDTREGAEAVLDSKLLKHISARIPTRSCRRRTREKN